MKPKICFVVSSAMTVNAFLQQPIRRLSDYFDVYIALNLNPGETLPELEGIVTILPVNIERKISPWRDFLALMKLVRLFRQYDFKIVHSVTPKAGLLAMMAAFISRIDVRVHTFTGQVWVTRKGMARRILKGFDRLIAIFSTRILVDSPSQREFLLKECVVSENKSKVLHKGSVSGVNLERFRFNKVVRDSIRSKMGFSDEDIVFLFIGRLNRDKGVFDLALAFSEAAETCQKIRLLIVGPDEENIAGDIDRIVQGYADRVHMVGFSNKPEDYMSAADVLCLPSYREGFGNVIVEAAAVGIPAIGSRIYGISDAIADGETGLLFEVKNVPELVACIKTMAMDNELRSKLGQQAMVRVNADFSDDQLALAWLNYYQELT